LLFLQEIDSDERSQTYSNVDSINIFMVICGHYGIPALSG
jgi:hypothetical protein